jgi:methyltransferase (TIGR00027 family)
MGAFLPEREHLAADPYGVSFAHSVLRAVHASALRHPDLARRILAAPSSLRNFVLWMQLRTRAIDDRMLDFVARGPTQVVFLGAGHDMRAVRFRAALQRAQVFEVDHAETQRRKRACLKDLGVGSDCVFVPFDFAASPVHTLGSALAAAGHVPTRPTLTIWEGVTMYLPEPAVSASMRAVAAYSGPGSALLVSYIDAKAVHRPGGEQRLTQRLTALVGEPYLFGFRPETLGEYAAERGFSVRSDASDLDLAERYLPRVDTRLFRREERHIADLALIETRSGG